MEVSFCAFHRVSRKEEEILEIIKGTYTDAVIFSDSAETYAKAQVQLLCDLPASAGSRIRLMPDIHPGRIGPVGLTMTVSQQVMPGLLGVDLGCGMTCARIKGKPMELQKLDTFIRQSIPAGFQIRQKEHPLSKDFRPDDFHCARHLNRRKAALSLGSLGGGNHFIEVDRDESGRIYMVIHSGSRHLGREIADHYMRTAQKNLGRKGFDVPYEQVWLDGQMMKEYAADVEAAAAYASLNRRIMMQEICKAMKWKITDVFESVHNCLEEMAGGYMLRKGAASAKAGEPVIIPVNMRDGVLLGSGRGNEEWNWSAPHGAGRILRRDQVGERYTVAAFKREMRGIYCSCIGADTLDEAPFAYRDMAEIRDSIAGSAEITDVLKPVYNFKAGSRKQRRV